MLAQILVDYQYKSVPAVSYIYEYYASRDVHCSATSRLYLFFGQRFLIYFMYLYRTQHKILWEINNLIVETRVPTEEFWVSAGTLANRITGLSKKEKRVAMALAALSARGYTKYIGKADDNSAKITMTQKGLDALSLWEFKQLQNKSIGIVIRDVATVLVAIATIYSLMVTATEQRQTQEKLKRLEEEIHMYRK